MLLDKIKLEQISNKLLYILSQKSNRFKYTLVVLMVVSIFAFWMLMLVRPLNTQLVVGRVKLKQLNSLKKTCSQGYDQCSELSKSIDHLTSKFNKKISVIGNSSAYLGLEKVIECMNGNGVTLINYSPGKVEKVLNSKVIESEPSHKKIAKVEFGKKVTFELLLEGTFVSMFNFFNCLSAVKYCLKYNQISIIKNEKGLIECKLILDILQVSK